MPHIENEKNEAINKVKILVLMHPEKEGIGDRDRDMKAFINGKVLGSRSVLGTRFKIERVGNNAGKNLLTVFKGSDVATVVIENFSALVVGFSDFDELLILMKDSMTYRFRVVNQEDQRTIRPNTA